MRERLILFLKQNPAVLNLFWKTARGVLELIGLFVPIRKKTMLFCSFGGRKFDDSPKALYDEVCQRPEFKDWNLIWAFVEPEKFEIPRGKKIKVDTPSFFKALLNSRVWISNSGMDRGIELKRNQTIKVETWHGTPLKKIGGEENQGSMIKASEYSGSMDSSTIRCAQSEFDKEIFSRIWHAEPNSILLCDLPRNDALLSYSKDKINSIKSKINISSEAKVILYTPTYREYLVDGNKDLFIAPPIDLKKWEEKLSDKYVLLIRAHYAVSAALNIKDSDFVKDVSTYPVLNDLYAISDMMISDFSSTYFDYAILDRPMFCFAYDRQEYEEKRGLYLDLDKDLPCKIDYNEDSLIERIMHTDIVEASLKTKEFHHKYAPYAGQASKVLIDKVVERLNQGDK